MDMFVVFDPRLTTIVVLSRLTKQGARLKNNFGVPQRWAKGRGSGKQAFSAQPELVWLGSEMFAPQFPRGF